MLLAARDLTVSLDGRRILHDLRFDVSAGSWIGLLGPNGSGKTTLLRTIAGLLPYDGTLNLDGIAIHHWRPRALARRLAFVRQSASITFDFSVGELVLLGRAPHKGWMDGYDSGDRQNLQGALSQVELDDFEERSILTLSGGELQRVLLAQALVQEADLLLLDEPTAHLDVHYQFELMYLVQRLARAGRTVISVFHDLELASRFAGRLLILDHGRLVAAGPPAEVLTEALIASVFRMEAQISHGTDGAARIHYTHPLP